MQGTTDQFQHTQYQGASLRIVIASCLIRVIESPSSTEQPKRLSLKIPSFLVGPTFLRISPNSSHIEDLCSSLETILKSAVISAVLPLPLLRLGSKSNSLSPRF